MVFLLSFFSAVLKYHVVPETLYSAGLSCGDKIKTANGQMVHITKMFGKCQSGPGCSKHR